MSFTCPIGTRGYWNVINENRIDRNQQEKRNTEGDG